MKAIDLDIKLGKREAKVRLLKRDKNHVRVSVDEKIYDLDMVMVENGVYSILHHGNSHNLELIKSDNSKKYTVNTIYKSFDLEIIDAATRYQENRNKGMFEGQANVISFPMPGKIVKIPVKAGQSVNSGQTVIIVSSMKMENQYKIGRDAKIKKILVKEGDTISGNQPLIVIE